MTDTQTPDLFAAPPVPPSTTPGYCFLCWGVHCCPHPDICGAAARSKEFPE